MKIFIDSADIDEIKLAFDWGIADGVTTNPSLLKAAVNRQIKAGKNLDIREYLKSILEIAGKTPVSLEVTETSAEGMLEQGERIYDMFHQASNNVNIKIPVNPAFQNEDTTHFDGIKVIKKLTEQGIPVNCTLIFSPEQALLAAKAGATFISPFAGRVDDDLRKNAGEEFQKSDYYPAEGREKNGKLLEDNGIVSGIDLVCKCVDIIELYGYKSEIIAASLRNTRQTREAALSGAHIATLPFGVIKDMLKHHKTYEGMKAFTADIVEEYANLK
ncbi:MAG: transaldolase [Spirochaetes bacterium]|nr:transaldolase [Spirochaetota bacterium]